MSLSIGTRLGPYVVEAAIGAGGMGEVYRATDTNLSRHVAIKVLPQAFAQDAERLARFDREARTLAALNHPNIAQIYGLERSGGQTALVMELVEGPTLADRIAQGAIPVSEALPIARQIIEALDAAHELGIVHRDLKPANIKLKAPGAPPPGAREDDRLERRLSAVDVADCTVKVLDFGLAKAIDPAGNSSANASMSPTLTTPAMTMGGVILGTAAYMAPEQAKGRQVDRRADIWAFGCVLFEMLTGRRAFPGEDVSDTLATVLKSDPDWGALPADVPRSVGQAIRLCLEKDPRKRVRDITAVRLVMDGTFDEPKAEAPKPEVGQSSGRRTLAWAAAALVAGAVGAGVAVRQLQPAVEKPLAHFIVNTPEDAPVASGAGFVAISPDGRRLAYRATTTRGAESPTSGVLYVRELDRVNATRLEGAAAVAFPSFSPDGEWVLYADNADHTLKKISVRGGPAVAICPIEDQPYGASWGPGDTIVFSSAGSKGLMRVRAAGGVPERLTAIDQTTGETAHRSPWILPDGRGVIFATTGGERDGIAYVSLDDGTVTHLLDGGANPAFSPSGHLVYFLGGSLWAVGFDVRSHQLVGDPVPVVEGVPMNAAGAVPYSLAGDGTLVYATGQPAVGKRTLVWVDRQGKEEPIAVPPRAYTYARLSPDGTRVALDSRDEQNDIWTFDLARGTLTQLTHDPGLNRGPAWTPDGRRLAFSATSTGVETAHWQAADGSGSIERLGPADRQLATGSFTPDMRQLVFMTPFNPAYDIGVLSIDTGEVRMLLDSSASEENPEVSPDGRWLAYQSNESGEAQVYLRPFPDVTASRMQVSTASGTRPLWSHDGKELFYFVPAAGNGEAAIMAVPVTLSDEVRLGIPVPVVTGTIAVPRNSGRHYDVSPDGKRFLLLRDVDNEATRVHAEIHLVQSWGESLERIAPRK